MNRNLIKIGKSTNYYDADNDEIIIGLNLDKKQCKFTHSILCDYCWRLGYKKMRNICPKVVKCGICGTYMCHDDECPTNNDPLENNNCYREATEEQFEQDSISKDKQLAKNVQRLFATKSKGE